LRPVSSEGPGLAPLHTFIRQGGPVAQPNIKSRSRLWRSCKKHTFGLSVCLGLRCLTRKCLTLRNHLDSAHSCRSLAMICSRPKMYGGAKFYLCQFASRRPDREGGTVPAYVGVLSALHWRHKQCSAYRIIGQPNLRFALNASIRHCLLQSRRRGECFGFLNRFEIVRDRNIIRVID
jgi:hypothetical protein